MIKRLICILCLWLCKIFLFSILSRAVSDFGSEKSQHKHDAWMKWRCFMMRKSLAKQKRAQRDTKLIVFAFKCYSVADGSESEICLCHGTRVDFIAKFIIRKSMMSFTRDLRFLFAAVSWHTLAARSWSAPWILNWGAMSTLRALSLALAALILVINSPGSVDGSFKKTELTVGYLTAIKGDLKDRQGLAISGAITMALGERKRHPLEPELTCFSSNSRRNQ